MVLVLVLIAPKGDVHLVLKGRLFLEYPPLVAVLDSIREGQVGLTEF